MSGASRAWVAVALGAGFAAGWFARDSLLDAPPPLAPEPFDAGLSVDAGPPPPPPVDPLAILAKDRAEGIAWWATAPASSTRVAFERALALPAGVGFFDYLAPVYERSAFDEPDAGEPASLGFFVDRSDDGKTCRYLAGRVPLAQGGLRVGRACEELTTTPPRWLVVKFGGTDVLFDVENRRFATRAEVEEPPTFLFAIDEAGHAQARTAAGGRWRSDDSGEGRSIAVSPEIEAYAVSEVRPFAVDSETSGGRIRVTSPWLDGALTVRTSAEGRAFSCGNEASAVIEGNWQWREPLAMPGHGGYFVAFGSRSVESDSGTSERAVAVSCDAAGCTSQEFVLP